MFRIWQIFDELVCQHVLRWTVLHLNLPTCHAFSYKVMCNKNVLSPLVTGRIALQSNCSLIVTMKDYAMARRGTALRVKQLLCTD
jgi:hypothetical protein